MGKILKLVLLALFVWVLIFLYQRNDSIPNNIENVYQKTQNFVGNF